MNVEEIEVRQHAKERERELERLALTRVCGICGGGLITPWVPECNRLELVCSKDRTHIGFRRQDRVMERYQRMRQRILERGKSAEEIDKEIQGYQIKEQKRRDKKMTTETKLAKYQGMTTLTKGQATEILNACWPKAPKEEVIKAALLCASYQLNPLMKHVYLIPFKDKKTGAVSWSIVLGIGATRLLGSRRKPYKYVDGPRIMTEGEQERIFGKVDIKNIVAITVLADMNDMSAPGYGKWPKDELPLGIEKGNSPENMAFIRSERAALDRLLPGEIPVGVEIMDEAYAPRETSQAIAELPISSEMEPEVGETELSEPLVTEAQRRKIFAVSKAKEIPEETLKQMLESLFGLEGTKGLTKGQASKLIEALETR